MSPGKMSPKTKKSSNSNNGPSTKECVQFNAQEEKAMRETIDGYRGVMNNNDQSKENLYLKKIRLNHPWFRLLTFNSFKLLFDQCQLVQVRWGQKLYKQDKPITFIYFVLYGKMSLSYSPDEGDPELHKDSGHLGCCLGEELLFY